ncbi:MAG TPA: hypothetical protein VEW42_02115 [Candidatus Eisenbacteria bacterium]|nr:hypothetical protein [Candidatus Eisenbacteria bacterium]
MKILIHSLVLLASFGFVFVWEQGPFSDFTVQLLAIMVLIYLVVQFVRRKLKKTDEVWGGIPDVFTLNTAIFLLIYATGQMASWFFFLLYFLGFGITFIFEPATVFVFALGTIAIFVPEVLKNGGSLGTYIQLGSFLLISPLPYFFGKEYRDREDEEQEIQQLAERSEEAGTTIAKDVEDVIANEKKSLKPEDMEKLNEILEETEDLRSETKE